MTQTRAMLTALAAFFFWVLFDVGLKLGTQAPISVFAIMGIPGIVCAVIIFAMALVRRNLAILKPKQLRSQGLIASCSLLTNFCNTIALKHLPLTIFYVVVFTAPLLIALAVTLLKHEKLTATKLVCLVAGFAGVLIAIWPTLAGGGEWIGYVMGLIGVLGFVGYTVTINRIAATETAESIQFCNAVAVGSVGCFGLLQTGLPDQAAALALIGAGVATLIGNFLYNKALRHTSSSNVAQVHYTQLISGAILGYFIWHEMPTLSLVAGSLLIVGSGLVVAAHARRDAPPAP